MKKVCLIIQLQFFIIFSSFIHLAYGQIVTSNPTVRGTVIDKISLAPLPNAFITIKNELESFSTQSQKDGYFEIKNIPVGTYSIFISHPNYNSVSLYEQAILSGKELNLEIPLKEKVDNEKGQVLEEVVVKSSLRERTQAQNRAGIYRIDIHQVQSVAGNRNDPANVLKNLPSVNGTDDQRGLISVRGGSPWATIYRIEDMYVTPPVHFSNLGINGSQVTMLNDEYMRNFDFHIGSFDSKVGNALGGVIDIHLIKGNNKKTKGIVGSTFNGWEVGLQGPFSKKSKASYFVSYRYSLLGSLAQLGLLKPKGNFFIPYYQDLSFKVHIPTTSKGTFSIWGIIGPSNTRFNQVSDLNLYNNIARYELAVKYLTGIFGFNHTYRFNENTFGKFYVGTYIYQYGGKGRFLFDEKPELNSDRLDFQYKNNMFTSGYDLMKKINRKNDIKVGANIEYYRLNVHGQVKPFINPSDYNITHTYLDGGADFSLLKAYISYKHYFTENFQINSGIFSQFFLLNNSFSIEPRISAEYTFARKHIFSANAGLHSQTQPLDLYFFNKNEPEQRQRIDNLQLNRSFQTALTYNYLITPRMNIQFSAYYHYHYNIATDDVNGAYSVLNSGAGFFFAVPEKLSNKGKGRAYGIEFMLNYNPYKGFYFMLSGALFHSQYAGSDGIWRNTFFDNRHKTTFLMGKQWALSKSQKVKFNIDTKLNYSGGNWVSPFLPGKQQSNFYAPAYDEAHAFSIRLPYYLRWDMRAGITLVTGKVTHNFYVEYWNILNRKNVFDRQMNLTTGAISYIYQINTYPIFFYKLYF